MAHRLDRASTPQIPEALASCPVKLCFDDFLLSRQAMMVSAGTLKFYRTTAGEFIRWLVHKGKLKPTDIEPRDVRSYLNEFVEGGAKPNYVHNQARAVKTFLRFLHEENYIPGPVKFHMPPTSQEKLPYLTADEVRQVIKTCDTRRELALILLMVDTGLRRSELVALNWEDVDIKSGLVQVKRGKGGKARSVVVGAKARRALLAYRRTLDCRDQDPLIQTIDGGRFTINGLRSLLMRLSDRAGVHVSPHALRRTFATLSIRAGMSPLHLQGLLGHSTLEMTRRYTQMVEDDLVDAHRDHGPIDNLI